MPTLKIIGDNAAKRLSSITASTQAGNLSADRLKLGVKSKVWRSTAKTATISISLPAPEILDCVALAFTNMTATGTIRVQGYATSGAATPAVDVTKTVFVSSLTSSQAPGVNNFSAGSATQAVCWFTPTSLQRIDIILTDNANAAGYIEASCIVVGASWSPKLNAGWGAGVSVKDTTKNERTESGNLRSDRGTIAKVVSFELKNLTTTERNKLWAIALSNGLFAPLFVSLYPSSADAVEEQIHQIYGKMTQQTKLMLASFGTAQTSLELEEV